MTALDCTGRAELYWTSYTCCRVKLCSAARAKVNVQAFTVVHANKYIHQAAL
jgi:hypothetical protein